MSKTNKELAVELMCAWLESAGKANQNKGFKLPSVQQVNEAINILYENLSKLED